jgi:hypothetical protein
MSEQNITLLDVFRAVERIDTKMDIYTKRTDDHDARLDKVEKRQTYAMGAAGATGFLASLALAIAGLLPK